MAQANARDTRAPALYPVYPLSQSMQTGVLIILSRRTTVPSVPAWEIGLIISVTVSDKLVVSKFTTKGARTLHNTNVCKQISIINYLFRWRGYGESSTCSKLRSGGSVDKFQNVSDLKHCGPDVTQSIFYELFIKDIPYSWWA